MGGDGNAVATLFRELLHGVTRHLEIGNFLVYDRLNYELAIIVALKGIAFSSFLAYLIIY